MKTRRHFSALVAAVAATAWLALAGTAMGAFPNFSDCPTSNPDVNGCIDIQSRTGSLEIKGFTVPLGDSLEIRGGATTAEGTGTFIPPAGTNGFFSQPVQIPGGILGIDWPIPGNAVTGLAQLAGAASDIRLFLGFEVSTVRIPVKVKLSNPILGSDCYIGTNRNPVQVSLTTGTTNPPAPNRPIRGSQGRISFEEGALIFRETVSVDNAFSIPGATGCGLLGVLNPIVNLKLGLPSAGGNNTMIVENDVAVRGLG